MADRVESSRKIEPGPFRRVLWSVDPFEGQSPGLRFAAHCLKAWAARFPSMVIEPVYVLSPTELNLSSEFTAPWLEHYQPGADRALAEVMERAGISNCLAPRVLVEDAPSTHAVIEALGEYALTSGSDAILVSTHGRTGVRRIFMGSFAETLLVHAPIPVIVVGPRFERESGISHILFPTDFGERSRDILNSVISIARAARAKLTLLHEVPHPVGPVLQSGVYLLGGSWIPVDAYFTDETQARRDRAQEWANQAARQGIETDFIVEPQSRNIADLITAVARARRVGLITMEAHSGPVASALVGSITRQVVRAAPCPVWVAGPKVEHARLFPPREPQEESERLAG